MISGFSPAALMQLQDALGGGGSTSTVVIDFERLASEMQRLVTVAERIAESAANPTFAAGDEMCRRAATALQHGWYEDAIADATRSVEAYPYRGAPHLLQGLALLHLGRAVGAFGSLKKCIRYGEAAEPQHAATAALLGASMAYGADKSEQAHEMLSAGFSATDRRCPSLLVALVKDHVLAHDPQVAASLLRDDPRAWIGVEVPDDFFGEDGERVTAAFAALVEELRGSVSAAEQFTRSISELPADQFTFYREMFDSGSQRYSVDDGYRFYSDGGAPGMLRQLVGSLESVSSEPLPVRMLVGFDIIRALGFRADSTRPMPQRMSEWHTDLEYLREKGSAIEPDETCLDVLIESWSRDFDWNIRRYDQPRGVGQARGTGIYLRALRAYTYYLRDRQDVMRKQEHTSSLQPPQGFRVRQWQIEEHNRARQTLPVVEAYLSLPPPDVSALQRAMSNWLTVSKGSGQSVIAPFAAFDLPSLTAEA
jgi:hypothetical protein